MQYNPKTKVGILGENKTDTDCIAILISRLNDRVISKGMGAGGGGNMFNARKMTAHTRSLFAAGCTHLLVVHDLDRDKTTNERNDEVRLRARLEKALVNNPITRNAIIVPIEEIEAWLLSAKCLHPEKIPAPKEKLKKLDRNHRASDNARIAGKINIDELAQKCPSFRPLQEFLKGIA